MAHSRVETVARPAANLVGSLNLRAASESLIDEHSAHQQPSSSSSSDGSDGANTEDENWAYENAEQPEWWPQTRGVPRFRPLNTTRDNSSRAWGQNGPEIVFTTMMLGGVWLQGLIRTGWYKVGSPGSKYFKYDVGGQF